MTVGLLLIHLDKTGGAHAPCAPPGFATEIKSFLWIALEQCKMSDFCFSRNSPFDP